MEAGVDLNKLLMQNKEVFAIDVLPHVQRLSEEYTEALLPPPPGIYVTGSIEPLFSDAEKYYERSQLGMEGYHLKSIEEILHAKEDIVNSHGEMVLALRDIRTKGRYLKDHPTIPAVGVKAAVSVVLGYLNSLNKNTNINLSNFKLEYLVKPEYIRLVTREDFSVAFESLLDAVMEFINGDTWHIYFYSLKGTTLVIEKTIDWRIYQYYLMTQQRDSEEE